MKKISIIVPCYNEELNVNKFCHESIESLKKLNYKKEYIFINDGSKDNTFSELKKLLTLNESIKIINFSRNFGKESAILAGLEKCTGDYAVLIDADLQQHPRLINQMILEMEKDEDLDIVAYYQEKRIENKFISFSKKIFYKLISKMTGFEFKNGASDFRLFKRNVIDAILSFSEQNRFQKGIFAYIGFNTKYLPYSVEPRNAGCSTWNLKKLIKYAFSGLMSFSDFPLKLIAFFGIIEFVISILVLIICLVTNTLNKFNILIILLTFLFSILQLSLCIISKYLYRTYNETKNRPIYFVKEVLDNEKNN